MSPKLEDAKSELIDRAARVVVHADSRLDGDRARTVEEFVRRYWRGVAPADLLGRSEVDVYGAALAHWELARVRRPGTPALRVYSPDFEQHGWQTPHTVVEVVTDDMPFLVDSVSMAISRAGAGIHLIVHPLVAVVRDGAGRVERLLDLDDEAPGAHRESYIHVEIDRQTESEVLARLEDDLRRTLADVRAAVADWRPMVDQARRVAADLAGGPAPAHPDDVAEARALLEWMAEDHFTFLAYREYTLDLEDGEEVLRAVPETGLGLLRGSAPSCTRLADLAPGARRRALDADPLVLTKTNAVATVHRPAHLDYVSVKRFDGDGRVVGERRFIGLYTAAAYTRSPRSVPVLRRKVAAVLARADLPQGSHVAKDFLQVLETYPRDELFQIGEDDLYEHVMGIVHLQERRRVRLFLRRDDFGRFVSALVYLPRDRYTTRTRLRIQDVLLEALGGTDVEFSTRLTESVLARLHFVVQTPAGARVDLDAAALEERVAGATRTWEDQLRDALVEQCGEEEGVVLARRYADAFPPGYRDDYLARAAVPDIRRIEALRPGDDLDMSLYRPLGAERSTARLKLYRAGGDISLSEMLPLLRDLGVTVTDERPYLVEPAGRGPVWIYDFGLVHGEADFDAPAVRRHLLDAVGRVWRGDVESDGFNRLVLGARLGWRDVVVLRAYARYLRQAGTSFSQSYIEDALAGNPAVVRLLVELFHTRFEPGRPRTEAEREEGRLLARLEEALDAVESLDEDRILRSFLRLVRATLRTNAFQPDAAGAPKPYLSLKLDPGQVPELPEPRPTFEIFLYAPWVEGVHLRAGRVARGGIRWSDRREDFRTEILGLMKAQMVKNAVIVPVGAKGGFVVKRPPAGGDRAALLAEVERCYRTLIHGMLDVTDNLVAGAVVPPADVVRYDGDDPYLVVAADKGTATFSDLANAIAAEHGFWLGDAFASGGSAGYDHKAMGITARGAWVSVERHFRTLGIDVATDPVTVVGIGDMSGDVFGNGMLLSRALKLVGAFDHRHVFLDPDPDPAASFAERERLFALPRSSWADYDPSLISPGGGVFPRSAKSVPLSPEVRRLLAVDAEAMAPNEVIRALLRAPVDLLWNGGIGTFVKASHETNAEVGDKTSDAIRVDARDLRCRVVGEGGNLGFTQRARVEYALGGGRIYTDAIDNSAGVDASDHEVNIKILLDAVVDDGDMTLKQRNELLAAMTDEVAALVLRDNVEQTKVIDLAAAQAAPMLEVHGRYLRALEQTGRLDRHLEALPDEEALGERRSEGKGLTPPELAVLLAYTKIVVGDELLESDVPEDPYLCHELERYFPTPLRERFRDRMQQHRLRRELVATAVANRMVNRGGITAAFRLGEETSATTPEIARALTLAEEVYGLPRLWKEVEALDGRVGADVQVQVLLAARTLVERAARWLLRNRRPPIDVAGGIATFAEGVGTLADRLAELLPRSTRADLDRRADALVASGVPAALAARVAGFGLLVAGLDVVEVARATERPVPTVAEVYFALGERLDLDWLRQRVADLPRENRWQTLARAALRDDLAHEHAALAAEVLRTGAPELPAAERIDTWLEANAATAHRALQVLAEVRTAATVDLATLSVALREIRNITRGAAVSG